MSKLLYASVRRNLTPLKKVYVCLELHYNSYALVYGRTYRLLHGRYRSGREASKRN